MSEHHFSESNNGAMVDAEIGDLVEIRLSEIASAGYRWSLQDPPSDVLEPLETKYEFAQGRVGGGSVAHFRFRVRGRGESVIRLVYRRPWEEETSPLRAFEITMRIR